ncbi:epoxyqueuosine reductase [Anaeromicrobium sediminis]|uniref:4Fe-4S ferredoxin-type domain-containing protein n=1 Tax=Anaeromicrobium sediminis TaxID=1478221 RepID=A0A267MN34_9FIRM|nr:epoxyqueuosine reductase [Anaeromicrobium sediminis]PAB60233.1 hypothetical protein CCE28_04865 [Anaeromicrobium sediminis]
MKFNKDIFIKEATDFLLNCPMNKIEKLDDLIIYDKVIFGFASSEDKLFEQLKKEKAIGPNHRTPKEWMPEGRTVISYFLSFSKRVRESNRIGELPSTEWLYGRIEGELMNLEMKKFIIKELEKMGVTAIAPTMDKDFRVENRKSNWSERHVGYVAGLGTFGLSESIITKLGAAGRVGSVITSLEIEPTHRAYSGIYEYCLWYRDGSCGKCIKRCPANAISEKGKDKDLCAGFVDMTKEKYDPRYGCGKCQTGVVCENRNVLLRKED